MTTPNRVLAGVPTGGQFAPGNKAEAADQLDHTGHWPTSMPPADERDPVSIRKQARYVHTGDLIDGKRVTKTETRSDSVAVTYAGGGTDTFSPRDDIWVSRQPGPASPTVRMNYDRLEPIDDDDLGWYDASSDDLHWQWESAINEASQAGVFGDDIDIVPELIRSDDGIEGGRVFLYLPDGAKTSVNLDFKEMTSDLNARGAGARRAYIDATARRIQRASDEHFASTGYFQH